MALCSSSQRQVEAKKSTKRLPPPPPPVPAAPVPLAEHWQLDAIRNSEGLGRAICLSTPWNEAVSIRNIEK